MIANLLIAPSDGLELLLILLGLVCFVLTVVWSRKGDFSIDRTCITIAGGSRIEFSKPMVFAIGAVLCFAIATALMLYGNHHS
jgi:hypothetical protein